MKDRSAFVIIIVLLLAATGLIIKSFFQPPRVVTQDKQDKEDKINLRVSGYGGYLEEDYLKEIKEEYENINPSIRIILEISPASIEDMSFKSGFIPNYEQRILADYAANNSPDIFYIPPGRIRRYAEAEALLNVQPFLDEEYSELSRNIEGGTFAISRGSITLGISSKTKYPEEAFKLLDYIYKDYQKRLEEIRANAIKQAAKFLLPESGLESSDAFQLTWNAYAVAMNRSDLVLWTAPDSEPLYWGFRAPYDHYDYVYVQLGFRKEDRTKITSGSVSLRAPFADNFKMVHNFKTCMGLLIRAVDPTLTTEEVEKVLIDLGFDLDNFDLTPFHMIGAVYYHGYEYRTEALGIKKEHTMAQEFSKMTFGPSYKLIGRKQDAWRTPYRRYP